MAYFTKENLMKIPAQNYLDDIKGKMHLLAQETRTSYLTALGLIFTVDISVLLGSITLSDKLNLNGTTIAQNLTYISWGLLGVSAFFLAFAILIFLVQQSMGIVEVIQYSNLAIEALKNGEDAFHVKGRPLFLRYFVAFIGFLGFILGLLNMLLAIMASYIHICGMLAILCNIILIVVAIIILAPLIKNNKSVEEIIKNK